MKTFLKVAVCITVMLVAWVTYMGYIMTHFGLPL